MKHCLTHLNFLITFMCLSQLTNLAEYIRFFQVTQSRRSAEHCNALHCAMLRCTAVRHAAPHYATLKQPNVQREEQIDAASPL